MNYFSNKSKALYSKYQEDKLKVKILKNKAGEEMSFIAKNILISSANQLKAKIKELRKNSP